MKEPIEIKVEFLNEDEPMIIEEKFDDKEIEDIKDAKEVANIIQKNGIIHEEILTGYTDLRRIVTFYPHHMIKKITIIEKEVPYEVVQKMMKKNNQYK